VTPNGTQLLAKGTQLLAMRFQSSQVRQVINAGVAL
jgi:hypothetical protein